MVNDQWSSENSATELLNKPLLSFLLRDSLEVAKGASSGSTAGNSFSSTGEDNVEVHAINTS